MEQVPVVGVSSPPTTVKEDKAIEVLHELGACRVEKQGNVVAKTSPRTRPAESDALKLLEPLGLPIPRSLGFEESSKSPYKGVLRMSYVEGEQLDKVWPIMTATQKSDVALQLRNIISAIRTLEPPRRFIGSCNDDPVRDCRRIDEYTSGPFEDEKGFNSFLCDFVGSVPPGVRRALEKQLRADHRIVFSHGDLSQHNILVKDNRITALIDWEFAGWYPEYWDYIKFFERHTRNRDWYVYADTIFEDTYDDELAHYQAICRWQLP